MLGFVSMLALPSRAILTTLRPRSRIGCPACTDMFSIRPNRHSRINSTSPRWWALRPRVVRSDGGPVTRAIGDWSVIIHYNACSRTAPVALLRISKLVHSSTENPPMAAVSRTVASKHRRDRMFVSRLARPGDKREPLRWRLFLWKANWGIARVGTMEDPAEVILFLRESLSNLLHKNVPVVRATARVAAMRFTQLVEEEFQSFWANPEATTAHFESRIEKLRERIRAEMLQLWAGKEVGFKEPDGVDAALIRLSNQALLRVRQVGRLRPSGTVRSATRQQEQMAPADQTIRTQTSRRAVDEMNAAGAKDVDYISGTT